MSTFLRRTALTGTVLFALASCTTNTPTSVAQRRQSTAERFLGRAIPQGTHWTADRGPLGGTWMAYIPGVGVVSTDATGSTVLTAVLSSRAPGPPLDAAVLLQRARTFAASKVPAMTHLSLYRKGDNKQGFENLFTATWRDRRGDAWLPMRVTVSVDQAGRPAGFAYNPTSAPRINTHPAVTSEAAEATAITAVGPGAALAQPPELDVIGPPLSKPLLVWVVEVSVGLKPQVPTLVQVVVDAGTGNPVREQR